MVKFPLLLLVGPTAVGKTEIAIELAGRIGGEIISADSRLFYRGMDIGTAKPTPAERARVPHHLIDIAGPAEIISLAVFQKMAAEAIAEVHARGRLPMLVGGTGQYVRAVTQGWQPPEVKPDSKLREVLGNIEEERGGDWLHQRLRKLDPDAADKIDPRNVRRTIRAMEVILTTGRRYSQQRGRAPSPYQLLGLGVTRPRPELYRRIDARIDGMFAAGLLDEVRGLLDRGCSPDLPSMSAIGYRECAAILEGRSTVEEAKANMRRATRMFVRRQGNWFRESDPNIKWFTAGENIVEQIEIYVRRTLRA